MSVNLIDPATGKSYAVDESAVPSQLALGWRRESAPEAAERTVQDTVSDEYSGLTDKFAAGAGALVSGATLGLSDALIGLTDENLATEQRRQREANPITAGVANVVGGIGGMVTGVGPAGAVAKLGSRIAGSAKGAGSLARVGAAAVGGATEGAIVGAGSGLSEVALSEDPLDVERALSTISSKALYGGLIGGAAGTIGKAAELGLAKASRALDDVATKAETRAASASPEVAGKSLADEIAAHRAVAKSEKQFLAVKDVDMPAEEGMLGMREIGAKARKVNQRLAGVLDNPKGLAQNPRLALDGLQREEQMLQAVADRAKGLRAKFVAEGADERLRALDSIAPALERNRALQTKITDFVEQAKAANQASPRTLPEQISAGAVQQGIAGVVGALPIPFAGTIGQIVGAKAANLIGEKVFGRIGAATAEAHARSIRAVASLFESGAKATGHVAPLATRTLAGVTLGRPDAEVSPESAKPERLADSFRKRSAEIREQVTSGPDGAPMMRLDARKRVAQTLRPIGVHQPILADRMETLAAKRVEFLASKMPRRPAIGAIQMGPDNWSPSDMEMRTWARYVAAVEDPQGIIERLSVGAISPEDAEVMREVYPAQLAEITAQVLARVPTLRKQLPYDRRLALSMMTGVAVDPAMEPAILRTLQGQFGAEPEPPKASPQFGSVRAHNEPGTLSERRERGDV